MKAKWVNIVNSFQNYNHKTEDSKQIKPIKEITPFKVFTRQKHGKNTAMTYNVQLM